MQCLTWTRPWEWNDILANSVFILPLLTSMESIWHAFLSHRQFAFLKMTQRSLKDVRSSHFNVFVSDWENYWHDERVLISYPVEVVSKLAVAFIFHQTTLDNESKSFQSENTASFSTSTVQQWRYGLDKSIGTRRQKDPSIAGDWSTYFEWALRHQWWSIEGDGCQHSLCRHRSSQTPGEQRKSCL